MDFFIFSVCLIIWLTICQLLGRKKARKKESQAERLKVTGKVVDYKIISDSFLRPTANGRNTTITTVFKKICYIEDKNKVVYNVQLCMSRNYSNVAIDNLWDIGSEISISIKKYLGEDIYFLENESNYVGKVKF